MLKIYKERLAVVDFEVEVAGNFKVVKGKRK